MMVIIPINGKNERMGKLFRTPKHLLLKDGLKAIERTVNYMTDFGPTIIYCSLDYDKGLSGFNRKVVPPTDNVIDTIHHGINANYHTGLFIVDCDVIPEKLEPPISNTVYLFRNERQLKHYSNFEVSADGLITDCNEKGKVTEWAGAGVYYFESVSTFLKYSNYCKSVSEVVKKMIVAGEIVMGDTTSDIFRFGTLQDINGL